MHDNRTPRSNTYTVRADDRRGRSVAHHHHSRVHAHLQRLRLHRSGHTPTRIRLLYLRFSHVVSGSAASIAALISAPRVRISRRWSWADSLFWITDGGLESRRQPARYSIIAAQVDSSSSTSWKYAPARRGCADSPTSGCSPAAPRHWPYACAEHLLQGTLAASAAAPAIRLRGSNNVSACRHDRENRSANDSRGVRDIPDCRSPR